MPSTFLDRLTRKAQRSDDPRPFPHQFAFYLNSPVRRWLSNPERVVESLGLSGSEHVLELGPGPGFFSVPIARRLGEGHLDLFDVQPEMLAKARRRLEKSGLRDVGFHVGQAGEALPFPDKHFDVAFLACVIGEVPDRPTCIRSLARVLKPGGSLVFFEHFPDPDRLSVTELRELVEGGDFEFVDATGSIWRDMVRFTRRSE